ncbi:unnamed protein product [Rhodiola kirilowii]
MANHLFGYNPKPTSSTTPTYAQQPPTTYASRPLADSYFPSDPSFPTSSRYFLPSVKLPAHSSFLASASAASSLYNYPDVDIAADGPYSAAAFSRIAALAGQGLWSGVDASSYQSVALKRSSEALYHHNILGTHSTIGQNDWLAMSYLAKRPRIESSSILPTYPRRPGEKDCAHYMLTRTCKFGGTCKFDHPVWVPEGGIPDWKEVPPVANEGLPERPGEPDCPYFLKTQRCKFGLNCKFNHPREKVVDMVVKGESAALPDRPSEPPCAFYLKTGICKFGATCKFHHPKDVPAPVLDQGKVTSELESFSAKIEGTTGETKSNILPTPALVNNSKGLPIRPGEMDCPFYLKTNSCKYGATCRFNHPDQIGQTVVPSPTVNFSLGVGNPAVPALQSFDQFAKPDVCYHFLTPKDMFLIELVVYFDQIIMAKYYMKTGVCKFGERCRFHHPVDRSAPSIAQENVKLTLAGYPRREGALACPYYMKTSACKYRATCKFDHPPPAEVLAIAAAQATSTAPDIDEEN